MYKGIYAEMVYANKFNENSDLSTMYLGQTKMTRDTRIKAEERFPITGQEFASGKITRWHRMSNFIKHRSYKIIHIKIPTICDAKLYMHYPSSLQTHKEFKWEMDNMLVYFLLSQ